VSAVATGGEGAEDGLGTVIWHAMAARHQERSIIQDRKGDRYKRTNCAGPPAARAQQCASKAFRRRIAFDRNK
jgi:hypothetical protein